MFGRLPQVPLAVLLAILLGVCDANAASFTPLLWLDANDLDGDGVSEGTGEAGIFTGFNSGVGTWVNKARGPNATALDNKRPTFVENGLNSMPVVQIQGSHANNVDYLTIGTLKTHPGDLSAFFVLKPAPEAQQIAPGTIQILNGSSGIAFLLDHTTNTIGLGYNDGSAKGELTSGSQYTPASFHPHVAAFKLSDSDGSALFRNGNPLTLSSTSYTARALEDLGIPRPAGNASNYIGDYAEVILFDRALSDREMANVNAYLSEKWGLPVAGGGNSWRGYQLVSGLPEPSTWALLLGAFVTVGAGRTLRRR